MNIVLQADGDCPAISPIELRLACTQLNSKARLDHYGICVAVVILWMEAKPDVACKIFSL